MNAAIRHLGVVAVVLSAGAVQRPALAGVISFTSSADFLTAIGGTPDFLEDYEEEAVDTLIASGGTLNGITYTFPDGVQGRIDIDFNALDMQSLATWHDNGGSKGSFTPGESFFVELPEPVLAFGVFINATASTEYFISVSELSTVVPTSGTHDTNTLHFVGLISTEPFTTVEIGATQSAPSGYNVDNLMYVAVPEPSGICLTALAGLAFLATVCRLRAAAAR